MTFRHLGLVVLCAWQAVIAAPIEPQVVVPGGWIEGVRDDDGLKRYLGVPYAAPPVGDRRWAPTSSVTAWEGVRPAREHGPQCLQPEPLNPFYASNRRNQSEDCLTLNVWTRATSTDARLPVMVWFHGGALLEGAGELYPGDALTRKGVILVTVNYRLGPLGFFAHPELSEEGGGYSGNQGYRDQIASLEWVRDHIEGFGGDPSNVTIFGESAGSWAVNVLQASPLARSLFHKAIGQSGARLLPLSELRQDRPWARSAEDRGLNLADQWARSRGASLAELRGISGREIIAGYEASPELFWDFDALTIVDGEVLEEQIYTTLAAGRQADIPLLLGSNEDEGIAFDVDMLEPETAAQIDYRSKLEAAIKTQLPELEFVQRDALYPSDDRLAARESYIRFQTDVAFTQPLRQWAELMVNVPSPAYLYWWDWHPVIRFPGVERQPTVIAAEASPHPPIAVAARRVTSSRTDLAAFHAAEIPYVFGTLGPAGSFAFEVEDLPRERRLSDLMMTLWSEFARTGVPSAPGVPVWPEFTPGRRNIMVLGRDIYVAMGIRQREVDAIAAAFERRRLAIE